jgi:Rieske Fe-S protein
VPVGGGLILDNPAIVLTRTSGNDVHAFSAVCTHQGCTVNKVAGGTIDCPCHGSRFDAATGAVVRGPAARPLPAVTVTVRGGNVYTS